EWVRSGRAVSVHKPEAPEPLQWSAPANFQQVQRGTLALRRREIITCPPTQYAEFMVRWQKAHPATQGRGADAVAETLERLHGVFVAENLGEQSLLTVRVADYQPRWLDDIFAGQWLWIGRGGDDIGPGDVAFLQRERLAEIAPAMSDIPLSSHEQTII